MSGLGVAALVVTAAWLGALTVVVVLVVRQIALVTARLDHAGAEPLRVYGGLMDDGPALGSRVPKEVTNELPELERGLVHLILLSATCSPCRELANGLRDEIMPANRAVIALVPGRPELADGVIELLPPSIRAVHDPLAEDLAGILGLERVPNALTMRDGVVIAKAPPLDSANDLLRFMELSGPSPNGNGAVVAREGAIHAS